MEQPTNPTDLPIMTGLTPLQADGLACVRCGKPTMYSGRTFTPVGRSNTGSQVFACSLGFACVPATLDTAPAPVADPADTVRPGNPNYDEWLAERAAEEAASLMRRSVRDGARSALDHCLAGPPSMGDHGLAVWYAKAAGRLVGSVRELLAELDKVAPETDGYTPPAEPVPAEMDRRTPDGTVLGDALTRMATWAPHKAATARRALTQGRGAAQAALVDLDTIMPVDLDNRALADVEIIRAALRRAAGWKSL